MAVEIPEDTILCPNTALILADSENGQPICIGRVIRVSSDIYGLYQSMSSLIRDIPDPNQPSDPEEPPNPSIGTEHAKVVFNIEEAQVVKLNNEDYYIAHANHIVGIIPGSYEELP